MIRINKDNNHYLYIYNQEQSLSIYRYITLLVSFQQCYTPNM